MLTRTRYAPALMPNIPSIPGTTPLPDLPDPVLDRERRPVVDNSARAQGAALLAKSMEQPEVPDSLAAPHAALGEIGEAVMRAGGAVQALAMKQRDAEADIQVNDGVVKLESARAKFEEDALSLEPSERGPELQRRLAAETERILANPKLHNVARHQLSLRAARYASQSVNDVTVRGAKETFARAKSIHLDGIRRAMADGNTPDFEERLGAAVKKNLLFGHEERALREENQVARTRRQHRAQADAFDHARQSVATVAKARGEREAIAALPKLVLPGVLGPEKEQALLQTVREHGRRAKAEALTGIALGIVAGDVSSLARIQELSAGNPHLDGPAVAQLGRLLDTHDKHRIQRDQQLHGERNAVDLEAQAKAYDPEADPDGAIYHQLKLDFHLRVPAHLRAEGLAVLDASLQRRAAPVPEGKWGLAKSLIDEKFDETNGLLAWRTPVEETDAGGLPVRDEHGNKRVRWQEDPERRALWVQAKTAVTAGAREFIREKPRATEPELQAEINRLLPDHLLVPALHDLAKLIPSLNTPAQPFAADRSDRAAALLPSRE